MPLPLGHAAIGWAAYETTHPSPQGQAHHKTKRTWMLLVVVTMLANLPDLDVLFGLLVYDNGAAIHRGPTHSLLFALLAGFVASNLWRLWRRIPRLDFMTCFILVFSHVAADMLFTSSPVSLMWPLELHLTSDHSGWGEVVRMVLFQNFQDAGIIAVSLAYVYALRYLRTKAPVVWRLAFARKRMK